MLKAAVAFGSVGIGSTTATTAWLKTDGSISRLTYEQANVSSVGWQYRTTACGGLEGLTSPFLRPSKSRRRRMHRPCEYRRETSVDDKCSAAFFCPTCRPATIVLGAVSPVHKWIARAPRSNYWMTDVRRTAKQSESVCLFLLLYPATHSMRTPHIILQQICHARQLRQDGWTDWTDFCRATAA